MKDASAPRDVSDAPPPAPKLGPAGRASMDGSIAPSEPKAARPAPNELKLVEKPLPGDGEKAAKSGAADAKPSAQADLPQKLDSTEQLSPERKEELRKKTPSAQIREMVNDVPPSQKVDPVYGFKVDRLEADHIVPYNTVVDMKGFGQLNHSNQEAVANYPPNFMGLDRRTNASKCDKSWAEWPGHPAFGPVPEDMRAKMITREKALRPELQAEIDKRLAGQAG